MSSFCKITKPKTLIKRKSIDLIYDFPSAWTLWDANKIREEEKWGEQLDSETIDLINLACDRAEETAQLTDSSASEICTSDKNSLFKNLNLHYNELRSGKAVFKNKLTWNRVKIHNRIKARKERKDDEQMKTLLKELNCLKIDNEKLKADNKCIKEKYVVKTCDVHLLRIQLKDTQSKAALLQRDLKNYDDITQRECKARLKMMRNLLKKGVNKSNLRILNEGGQPKNSELF